MGPADMFGHDVICSEFSRCVLVIYQWFSLSISPSSQPAGLPEEFQKSLASPGTVNLGSFNIFIYTVICGFEIMTCWAFR